MPAPHAVVCGASFAYRPPKGQFEEEDPAPRIVADIRLQCTFFGGRHATVHLSAFPGSLDPSQWSQYVPLLGSCAVSAPSRPLADTKAGVVTTELFLETPFETHIPDEGLQASFSRTLALRLGRTFAGRKEGGIVFLVHCAIESPLASLLLGGEGGTDVAAQFCLFVCKQVTAIVEQTNPLNE